MGLIAHAIELILKSERAEDKKGNAEQMKNAEQAKINKENDALELIFDDEDYN